MMRMIVTSIEQQKKNKSRYSVFIDGEFAFGLIMEDIIYFKLKEGEEISQEKYDYIMDTTLYIRAQDAAVKYLGYKMRTAAEVRKKLREYEYSEDIIEKVMAFLEKYEYIDDEAYCEKYIAESEKLRPRGKYLLRHELRQKGIAEEIIDSVLEDSDIDEQEQAEALLMKKYEGFADMDRKELNRVCGYLQRRGYSFDVIKAAIASLAEKGI